jgi:dephospho-CoA kinase
MKLIGVGGTNGSGKDTVGRILEEKYGWKFMSMSDMLRAYAAQQGLNNERKNLRTIGDALRAERGAGVLIDLCVEEYKKYEAAHNGLVIASVRNAVEASRVHELSGFVFWIDAPIEERYARIIARQREDDKISFEEFAEQERIEMFDGEQPNQLRAADVQADADVVIENTASFEAFEQKIIDTLANSELL